MTASSATPTIAMERGSQPPGAVMSPCTSASTVMATSQYNATNGSSLIVTPRRKLTEASARGRRRGAIADERGNHDEHDRDEIAEGHRVKLRGLRPIAVIEIGERIANRAREPARSRRADRTRPGRPRPGARRGPARVRRRTTRPIGAAAHRPDLTAAVGLDEPAAAERAEQHAAPGAVVSVLADAQLAQRAGERRKRFGHAVARRTRSSRRRPQRSSRPASPPRSSRRALLPAREVLEHAARVHDVELVVADRLARDVERPDFDDARARRLEARCRRRWRRPGPPRRPVRPSTPRSVPAPEPMSQQCQPGAMPTSASAPLGAGRRRRARACAGDPARGDLIGVVVDAVRLLLVRHVARAVLDARGTTRRGRPAAPAGSPSTRSPIIVAVHLVRPAADRARELLEQLDRPLVVTAHRPHRAAPRRARPARAAPPTTAPSSPNRRSGPVCRRAIDCCTRCFRYRRICSRVYARARRCRRTARRRAPSRARASSERGVARGRGVAAADHRGLVPRAPHAPAPSRRRSRRRRSRPARARR